MSRGESRECLGTPSVDVAGQNSAQAFRGDEDEAFRIHVSQGSSVDDDGLRFTAAADGESVRVRSVHVGHAPRFASMVPENAHTDSSQKRQSTSAHAVAKSHGGAGSRVRNWRAQRWTSPRASSAALFGAFPNLPPAECALVEARRPLRLDVAPTPRRVPRSAGDLTGRKVGSLEVLGPKHAANGSLHWECRCACSRVVLYRAYLLNDEAREDCGRNCSLRKAVRP